MNALMGIIMVLSIPLMILNMLGGIVSGVWLAILGDWRALGIGVACFLVSSGFLGFALLPSFLLAAPAAYCAEKGRAFGLIFFCALSSIYTLGLITAWCCGVLFLFMQDATASNLIPRLIWSYGVATGPWAYMASKDQGREGEGSASAMATFLAEAAYMVVAFLILFSELSWIGAIKVFGGFMAVGFILQLTVVVTSQKYGRGIAEQSY